MKATWIMKFIENSPLSKQERPTHLLKSSKPILNSIHIFALIYTMNGVSKQQDFALHLMTS